ncbi:MAG: hypothetical protein KIG81_06855, partial [Thermoguttaceae bacterium]|nr:hypothetical protein [Thermoguttaceae bacterium]
TSVLSSVGFISFANRAPIRAPSLVQGRVDLFLTRFRSIITKIRPRVSPLRGRRATSSIPSSMVRAT